MLSKVGKIEDLETARKNYKYFLGHFNFAKKQPQNTFSTMSVHKHRVVKFQF